MASVIGLFACAETEEIVVSSIEYDINWVFFVRAGENVTFVCMWNRVPQPSPPSVAGQHCSCELCESCKRVSRIARHPVQRNTTR